MVDFTGSPSSYNSDCSDFGCHWVQPRGTRVHVGKQGGQVCRAEFNVDADLHLQRVQRPNNRPADNAVSVAKI
jgi:hypothetical protein